MPQNLGANILYTPAINKKLSRAWPTKVDTNDLEQNSMMLVLFLNSLPIAALRSELATPETTNATITTKYMQIVFLLKILVAY